MPSAMQQGSPRYMARELRSFMQDGIATAWTEVNAPWDEADRFVYKDYTFIKVPSLEGKSFPIMAIYITGYAPEGEEAGTIDVWSYNAYIWVADTGYKASSNPLDELSDRLDTHAEAIRQCIQSDITLNGMAITSNVESIELSSVTDWKGQKVQTALVKLLLLNEHGV